MKLEQLTDQMKNYHFKGGAFSTGLVNYREEREEGSGRDLFQVKANIRSGLTKPLK